MRLPSIVLAALLAVSASPGALAQTPAAPGSVTVLTTPAGSVLILRGGKTYQLRKGDAVYDGDQVFTRSNGNTQLTFGACNYSIKGEQSLVLKLPADCAALPTTLASSDVVGGITVGTGAAGGVGATPVLLGLLAAGGATAAAVGGAGGSSSPASP